MSNDDRVQHFFAYFQQEAVALYHQKVLSRSDASAIASAFARIAADVERHVPEVAPKFCSECGDDAEKPLGHGCANAKCPVLSTSSPQKEIKQS